MSLADLGFLLLGALLEVAAAVAIVFGPELLDCLQTLATRDHWPGEQ